MSPSATEYARSGDISTAYQVVGDASIDLVLVTHPVRQARHGAVRSVSEVATLEERIDVHAVIPAGPGP
jgi:hypothetical protein